MSLPALGPSDIQAYLDRLALEPPPLNAKGLASLQAAHLMALPFHNLRLIAGDGKDPGLPPIEAAIEGNVAGVGGTCHLLTPAFATLARALGFDVHLAAASCQKPGDHLVAIVHLDGVPWLCDVGNGHPYLRPWRLDGSAQVQEAYGWHFDFTTTEDGRFALRRVLEDGRSKTVYRVDTTPRDYRDFEACIRRHHSASGYGPFLESLRAVRMKPEVLMSLRDAVYSRDRAFGRFSRPVLTATGAEALLVERFGLPQRLVNDALGVLRRRRPKMFGGLPSWIHQVQDAEVTVTNSGFAEDTIAVLRATARSTELADVPSVLISLASVDGRGLRGLLSSLREELDAFAYPGEVGVLVMDNAVNPDAITRISKAVDYGRSLGLAIHLAHVESMRMELESTASLGLIPKGLTLPLPIGAAREAQVAFLRRHAHTPVPGLPNLKKGPVVLWMIDDDLRFAQLLPDGRHGKVMSLFHRVAKLWTTLPQHSVILGTYCGDPPIPGVETWLGQLRDIGANLSLALELGPARRWSTPAPLERQFDDYYDLSGDRLDTTSGPYPWRPGDHCSVEDAVVTLLEAMGDLPFGGQLTRPLIWTGADNAPRPSQRRGGNTLFLDPDTIFQWPTPCVGISTRVVTRRADTIWATLASLDEPGAVREADIPLCHQRPRRDDGGPLPTNLTASQLKAASQLGGTALARALLSNKPIHRTLGDRLSLTHAHRLAVAAAIETTRTLIYRIEDTFSTSSTVVTALDVAREGLDAMETQVKLSLPDAGDFGALEGFLKVVRTALPSWRKSMA